MMHASGTVRMGQWWHLPLVILGGAITVAAAILAWEMAQILQGFSQIVVSPPAVTASQKPAKHFHDGTPVEKLVASIPMATPPPLSAAELAQSVLISRGLAFEPETFVQTVRNGSMEEIQLFLEAGMRPESCDSQGRSALVAAVGQVPLPATELLLHSGADPNAADLSGVTPLVAALRARNLDAARVLLKWGADVTGFEARDAIATAAFASEDSRVIRFALDILPDNMPWTDASRDYLFVSVRMQDSETIRLLMRKYSPEPRLADKSQPLLAYMVAWGNVEQCRLLLESGAAPDARLFAPAESRFMQHIQGDLLRHYLATESGMTPLMVAAGMKRPALVELLLKFKARPGAVTNKYRLAPIVFSAKTKDTASTLLLLGRDPADAFRNHVEISLATQTANVYLGGVHRFATEVSTGRPGFATKPGEYVLTDKHVVHVSTIYKVKMPYFMRLSCADFGMHEGYVPGYPASHGCIRMPPSSARRLFKEAPVGTVVRIR